MLGNYIEAHSMGALFEIWFPKEGLTKDNTGMAFLKCHYLYLKTYVWPNSSFDTYKKV